MDTAAVPEVQINPTEAVTDQIRTSTKMKTNRSKPVCFLGRRPNQNRVRPVYLPQHLTPVTDAPYRFSPVDTLRQYRLLFFLPPKPFQTAD